MLEDTNNQEPAQITYDEAQKIVSNNTPKNDVKQYLSNCTKAGLGAAAGQDALPVLAAHTVRAAALGIIKLREKSDPKDEPDDAQKAFAAYSKGYSKTAHAGASLKAQESKLRQLIKFGAGSAYDPIQVFDNAVRIHKEMSAQEGVSVKPAYAAYVDVARKQTEAENATRDLTDDQIREAMTKPESKEKTAEKVLGQVMKTLEKLIAGDDNGVKDQSEEVIQAHESIRQRLAHLIKANKIMELKALLEVE